ncbi:MAG: glycosyltransferase [Anaerolineales bacterium]|nr:glycosyltransferase [Anaerolineales bacterium]
MGNNAEYKICLQQRVFPYYRADFFEKLAAASPGGFSLFAGRPRDNESIRSARSLQNGNWIQAKNIHLFSGPAYLCYQQGIMAWLQTQNPDVLIVEANPRYPSTRRAIRWMHSQNRPVIGWGLGAPVLSGLLAPIRKYSRKTFLNLLDAVVSYSQNGAEGYIQTGFPQDKVFIAHNAAVPRPTSPVFEQPPRFNGRPRVLFVGRLQQRKRLDLLFQAASQLPENIQPEITIVGDGPARMEFEDLAVMHYPHTSFVGEKHGVMLEEYYAQADLFVLPGTGGLAIQQAMAQGLPVVVAEGDGTQNDLVRSDNGWLVTPGDVTSLRNAMLEALSDPAALRKKGMESYRIVREEINLDTMVDTFLLAIRTVLES